MRFEEFICNEAIQLQMTGTDKERASTATWLSALAVENMTPGQRLRFLRFMQPELVAGFWELPKGH